MNKILKWIAFSILIFLLVVIIGDLSVIASVFLGSKLQSLFYVANSIAPFSKPSSTLSLPLDLGLICGAIGFVVTGLLYFIVWAKSKIIKIAPNQNVGKNIIIILIVLYGSYRILDFVFSDDPHLGYRISAIVGCLIAYGIFLYVTLFVKDIDSL